MSLSQARPLGAIGLGLVALLLVDCRRISKARADTPVVHVDKAAAAGGDGSRLKPYSSLKTAIAQIATGGTIKVAGGRYDEGNLVINGKALTFLGGFAGTGGDFDTRDVAKYVTTVVGTTVGAGLESGVFTW